MLRLLQSCLWVGVGCIKVHQHFAGSSSPSCTATYTAAPAAVQHYACAPHVFLLATVYLAQRCCNLLTLYLALQAVSGTVQQDAPAQEEAVAAAPSAALPGVILAEHANSSAAVSAPGAAPDSTAECTSETESDIPSAEQVRLGTPVKSSPCSDSTCSTHAHQWHPVFSVGSYWISKGCFLAFCSQLRLFLLTSLLNGTCYGIVTVLCTLSRHGCTLLTLLVALPAESGAVQQDAPAQVESQSLLQQRLVKHCQVKARLSCTHPDCQPDAPYNTHTDICHCTCRRAAGS